MSRLLINENPLQVLPTLACAIGLNEAVLLQQIHYWMSSSRHVYSGRRWVYNSVPNWQKQFPFWSESTVKRALLSLERQGMVISANYNRDSRDKSKWYSINYGALDALDHQQNWVNDASGQFDPMHEVNLNDTSGQSDPMHEVSMTRPLPEITTENTQETTTEITNLREPKKTAPPAKQKAEKTPLQIACQTTWSAYKAAYLARYGTAPLQNLKTNAQIKQFVQRVGMGPAPAIAEFYLTVNSAFYVQKLHPVGNLLADAESLHTQWATGTTMTNTRARQIDKTQSNYSAGEEAVALLQAKREREARDANGG